MKAILALEDGTIFTGTSFGATGTVTGEACFNTSVMGYQEILTDPSYRGQIVAMTYPLIGNCGICEEDNESREAQPRGFVIEELSRIHSSWRADEPLGDWMKRQGIPGIEGIDTRRLATIIREKGSLRACLTTEMTEDQAVACACAATPLAGCDLVSEVTTPEAYHWDEAGHQWKLFSKDIDYSELPPVRYNIVAYDLGIKRNTLRGLRRSGLDVTVVPAHTKAEEVLAMKPDAVFLSNGPGDPAALPALTAEVAKLIGKLPIFGICLGHLIIGTALGGRSFKLPMGHHGGNIPVKNLSSGTVSITSQHNNFALEAASLPAGLEVTHVNLNDGTIAGFRHSSMPVIGVQNHPGAAPGATGVTAFYDAFVALIDDTKAGKYTLL